MKRFSILTAGLIGWALLMLAGAGEAALLDVGPVVPQVLQSSEPNLGHGFPLWYRDTNRVPLQLCTDRASGLCLTAEPNPGAPLRFPDNLGDELFWWVGDAQITTIPGAKKAILVQALEAAFSTGDVVPGAQVSFARIRIRFDPLPAPGEYVVTTPFKKFTFNVDPAALEINYTEDIGISEGGIFSGALAGSVGPFLYCKNPQQRPAGYIGDPNVPCEVLGSTFPSPEEPSNYFRIEGPNGFDHRTTLFSVMGKLYNEVTPTPLSVERVTYTREATGVQVSGFATTQPISNQTNPGAPFPANFALVGAPSALTITGGDLPAIPLVTNSPADGKFFGSSGLFPDPGTLPATVAVTNTADVPQTVRTVPLVDEVVIDAATFNPASNRLTVSASSYDRAAAPALALFLPGATTPLGTLVNGQLSVNLPLADGSVDPPRSQVIPPERVIVVSALGGRDSRPVTSLVPGAPNQPPVALDDTADVASGGSATIDVTANDSDPDPGDLVVRPSVLVLSQGAHGTATVQGDGTVLYAAQQGFLGNDSFSYTVRDGFGALSNPATVTVTMLDAGANSSPVAADDQVATFEDTPVSIRPVENDTDAEHNLDPSSLFLTAQPLLGRVRSAGPGLLTYTPFPDVSGSDSFTYQVRDSLGRLSNEATVAIAIAAVNDPPRSGNDAAGTAEDTPVTFSLVANDSDPEGGLVPASVAIVLPPPNGTAAVHPDGSVTYTPAPDFFGVSTFAYTVSDGGAVSLPATVTVTVLPVNDPPEAVNDLAAARAGIPVLINLTGNDLDRDGTVNPSSLQLDRAPAAGAVSLAPDGTASYTPNADFSGTDSFTYTVRDNDGLASAPATVTIGVGAASAETVAVLRAQYRAATGEWRVDGANTNPTSSSVTVWIGRDLTGPVLGSATVAPDGTWSLRLNGAAGNPVPDASATVSVQAVPGGGSRLAFPLAVR